MADNQYISRKAVDNSYRPKSYVMSPGLQRAREPFRFRNALTGLGLAGFGVGVWAYSIRAVKQDDFSDIDDEARALQRAASVVSSAPEHINEKLAAEVIAAAEVTPFPSETKTSSAKYSEVPNTRGILFPLIDNRFPSLLDPARKTLVWGAPSVDNIGRLQDRSKIERV
ncbi:hypothetical protein BJ138DRAFT_1082628 [Hygrophoropsis aurantiaca]|uniref:Uncharacterized protein n=1 Tax=Hygrophoropsis aurantiaca TaxID=72124 RepID=A0ACB8AJ63_9AGAM|nr:hypothetical protein BJ138DRAFT_1082628 [Hygrophoropsis aurantiaca]